MFESCPFTIKNDYLMIYREARIDPDGFLTRHLEEARMGFLRSQFLSPYEKADVAIVIPSHNEEFGDNRGNMRACLFAISKLRISEDIKVKVIVICHDCEDKDETEDICSQMSDKIEVVDYKTPLEGFSYPLQLGIAMLFPEEVDDVGIVDADTVVNQNWLIECRKTLYSNTQIAAIACPRRYFNSDLELMMYGEFKVFMEYIVYLIQSRVVSSRWVSRLSVLVSGNSYYKLSLVQRYVLENLGCPIGDPDFQDGLHKAGLKVVNVPRAVGVSDGTKHEKLQNVLAFIDRLRFLIYHRIKRNIVSIDDKRTVMTNIFDYFPSFFDYLRELRIQIDLESTSGINTIWNIWENDFKLKHLQQMKVDVDRIKKGRPYYSGLEAVL
jgi:hypothetical protein